MGGAGIGPCLQPHTMPLLSPTQAQGRARLLQAHTRRHNKTTCWAPSTSLYKPGSLPLSPVTLKIAQGHHPQSTIIKTGEPVRAHSESEAALGLGSLCPPESAGAQMTHLQQCLLQLRPPDTPQAPLLCHLPPPLTPASRKGPRLGGRLGSLDVSKGGVLRLLAPGGCQEVREPTTETGKTTGK